MIDRGADAPVVAVYRASLLPASETFIRSEALGLRRYAAIFVGEQRDDGLHLPPDRVILRGSGGFRAGAIWRHLRRRESDSDFIRTCRSRGVNLIHAHFGPDGLAALDLARALEVPLIVTYWGFDATMTDAALVKAGLENYVRRRPELFEEAALLVAVSQFIADELRRQGAPQEKLRVHHTGVPLRPPPNQVERAPVVLFVGRHVEKKGLADLVESMGRVRASVPAARLVVVGDGPLRRDLEARAHELDVDARFLGWLSPDGVAEQMQSVRVLCVPSRRAANGDAEGLPTVIAEAGAAGLPVVATRHSGIPEAIGEDRGGLLADEGDVEGIARQLVAVLTDDDLCRRLSASARDNVASNFDPGRQVAELERLYDDVLRTRR